MQQMMQQMTEAFIKTMNNTQNNGNRTTTTNNQNDKTKAEKFKHKHSLYCWSHGACAHESKDCNKPRPGHKKEATFSNKMGGSVRFCQPATDSE